MYLADVGRFTIQLKKMSKLVQRVVKRKRFRSHDTIVCCLPHLFGGLFVGLKTCARTATLLVNGLPRL